MRKKFLIILLFIFIWSSFFTIDLIRTKNDKKPVFSFYSGMYDDGGSKRYTGLFYNVYEFHYYNPNMTKEWQNSDGTLKDEYADKLYITGTKLVPWFISIDKAKE